MGMDVTWIHERADGQGGAERYIRETAAHLGARGVRSTLLYGVAARPERDFLAPFAGAYPIVDLRRQLQELAPDAIYVHQLATEDAAPVIAAARAPALRHFHDYDLFCLRRHKLTAVSHASCTRTVGLGCYACLGFVRRGPGPAPLRLVSVASLRRAQRRTQALEGFVVGSRFMGEHVAAHGFDAGRIHVLPLYAEPPAAAPEPARERDLVLYVGQLVRGKGVDVLLRAVSRTRAAVRLAVVGDGPQGGELRALAAGLGIAARVTFVGRVAPDAVAAFYRRARCLALPSRWPEPFGLVGVEAMSHGLPVVASDVGGVREWLADGHTGIAVPWGDAGALARALDRLVADDALARTLGERGRARHRERFLPEHHVAPLHALLRRVAAPGRAS
jgi:glycosyltransferase involved in cell wall biosynthesis